MENTNAAAESVAQKPSRLKRLAVAGVVMGLAAVGTNALAAWLTTGTGDSQEITARTGQAGDLTVDPGLAAGDPLFPTATVDSYYDVTNNLPYPVKIVSATVTGITVTGGGPGCTDATAAAVTSTTADVADALVGQVFNPAESGGTHVRLVMGEDSHNDCQGAAFTPQVEVQATSDVTP